MIRVLEKRDFDRVIGIVNENWKSLYAEYVNPDLLSAKGCEDRGNRLRADFLCHKLNEFVLEIDGCVVAVLSMGDTEDSDKTGAFEIWRVYLAHEEQGKGLGSQLLDFAEGFAKENGYMEILIWAFEKNCKAIRFYQKHGYRMDKEEYLGEPYRTYGVRLLKNI